MRSRCQCAAGRRLWFRREYDWTHAYRAHLHIPSLTSWTSKTDYGGCADPIKLCWAKREWDDSWVLGDRWIGSWLGTPRLAVAPPNGASPKREFLGACRCRLYLVAGRTFLSIWTLHFTRPKYNPSIQHTKSVSLSSFPNNELFTQLMLVL